MRDRPGVTKKSFAALLSTVVLFTGPSIAAAMAQETQASPAPPKLVIAISVDQFSADLFAQYRSHFTGGLARLAGGVVFPKGYQSHAATETCPGHSTILTGGHPARTGIIANNWYDLSLTRADKKVYCSEDPSVPGSSSSNYTVSAQYLKMPTLGDRMKAGNPATRVVSVAGKDRAAVMMAGKSADRTYWWNGKAFATYAGKPEDLLLTKANAGLAAFVAQPRPAMALPPVCAPLDKAVGIGAGKTVGTHRFNRAAGDTRAFRASPEIDAATLAIAANAAEDMALGKGGQTDLLIVGLSATDYVGHSYGTNGAEMCINLITLDENLGQFFTRMDLSGVDYEVMLTADHGGQDLPERQRENGMPMAERADPALMPEAIGAALSQKTGLPSPLIYGDGPFGDMYISRALTLAQRDTVFADAMLMLKRHPQVAEVFSHDFLSSLKVPIGAPATWTLAQEARASFDPARSGDFVVMLKSHVTPIPSPVPGYVATHGSPWDFDRRVPILFWRKSIVPFEQPQAVETVDILPTLAARIGLSVPKEEVDGRCLDLIAGPEDSCK